MLELGTIEELRTVELDSWVLELGVEELRDVELDFGTLELTETEELRTVEEDVPIPEDRMVEITVEA